MALEKTVVGVILAFFGYYKVPKEVTGILVTLKRNFEDLYRIATCVNEDYRKAGPVHRNAFAALFRFFDVVEDDE